MSWINKLDFQQSIQEIKEDEKRGNDFCLDPLRFEDLSIKEVSENLEELVKDKVKKARFDSLIEIDSPKKNYILRPCARPTLVDWIVYNAIVNFIGSKILQQIPHLSYSFNKFREKFKKQGYKRPIEHWLEFDNRCLDLSKKFDFLLVTDIVSFFENISLEVLRDRLLILLKDKEYQSAVNFLVDNLLFLWTEKGKVQKFGLPQGPTASAVLADIYLYPVDREMKKNNIPYMRYMDDIRLYAKSHEDLRRYLIILVRSLRELKLNLAGEKTHIYKTKDKLSLEKVFDPNKQTLDLIDKVFRSRRKDQIHLVIPSFLNVLDLAKDPNISFNERYLNFSISHLIDLMKLNLVEKAKVKDTVMDFLKIFEERPHLSNKICWLLVATSQYHREIGSIIRDKLVSFVLDKNKNIYEWQEMWALDTIRQIGGIRKRELNRLKKCVSKHNLCQAQLCLIQAENGSVDDKEEILDKIKKNSLKDDLYRYYFIAVQEIHKKLLKKVEKRIPKYFRDYVYGLKGKKYGFKYFLGEKEIVFEPREYY